MCKIETDEKFYLESYVNVKFIDILPFSKYLSTDLIENGLETFIPPFEKDLKLIKKMAKNTEKSNEGIALIIFKFALIAGSSSGPLMVLVDTA